MRKFLAVAVAFGLLATACSAGSTEAETPAAVDATDHEPMTITISGEWTGRECDQWKQIIQNASTAYPWMTVEGKCGVDDDKLVAAITAGNPADAVQSFGVDNVGKFCESGAWEDLTPYIEGPDGIDMSVFPPGALTYTAYGDIQCSLPFLTDAYGMYYNVDLFEAAGLDPAAPPKTTDELVDAARALTTFASDGSIETAGFVPWFGYYCCGQNLNNFSHMFGASFVVDGAPAFDDPAWAAMFEWQKSFIADVFGDGDFATGSQRLQQFVAGAGDEWGAEHDFFRGRVAMMIDGEWRNAFIKDGAPDLNYLTAPIPVAPDRQDLYGSGIAGGTVIGVPKGSAHPAEAWLLVKFLATDTATLVQMANLINNVPTTYAAIQSPDLDVPDQFRVFMDIFQNPNSHYVPTTILGGEIQDYIGAFAADWQAGDATDLTGALADATVQTQNALDQAAL